MPETTILCIGDSLTAGYPQYDPMWGGNPESQYSYWLIKECQSLNITLKIINKGVCGETTSQIARRLEHELNNYFYDFVLAFGGGNDAVIGYSPIKIKKNYKKLISLTQTHSITLIAGTATPFARYLTPLADTMLTINQTLRELFAHTKTLYADLGTSLADKEGYLKSDFDIGDGVHLNVLGYKKIALTFLPLLLSEIEQEMNKISESRN